MRPVSFFDQPLRVTRFKLVHAQWRRQRMELLPGVAPVSLVLARTDDTVVGLTDVRGYPNGFAFVLRVRWGLVADPDEQPPWPFPDWGVPTRWRLSRFRMRSCASGSSSPTAAGSPT
jgi:hypothetical protein